MNNSGLDLGSLDTNVACDKGIEIELLHPASREKLGVFVTVVGLDSSAIKEMTAEFRRTNERQAQIAKRQGKPDYTPPQSVWENFILNKAVVATLSWRTGEDATVKLKGEDLVFNVVNAKRLYTALPWVQVQVLQQIDDLANFMPG